MTTPDPVARFGMLSRILHWSMALLIVVMLFIGVDMVGTTGPQYTALISTHQSIGLTLLGLVAVRLVNRLFHPPPPLPASLPHWQRMAAGLSHILLYALMVALPVVGWAMRSASGYPVMLFGSLHVPAIVKADVALFAQLRFLHGALAMALFALFIAHLGAALFHRLIRKDTVLARMSLQKS